MSGSIIKPPYDPELAEVLAAYPGLPGFTKENIGGIREAILATAENSLIDADVVHEELTIPGPDGNTVELTVLRARNTAGGRRPAFYNIHGGGMILGTRYFGIGMFFDMIKQLDIVVITVEYRLAPEHPDPAPVEDCYAGLVWVWKHVADLGIDPSKIVVGGGSAGGGLSAGVALLARDRKGPKLHAQCLICPMLDDRMATVSSKQYANEGTWSGKMNEIAWDWLLGPGKRGSKDVSIYAAPARATNFSGLPPTFIDVGGAELFRDEDVAYALKLWEAGVPVELHVWPGGFHTFDVMAPLAAVSKAATEARNSWIKRVFTPTAQPILRAGAVL